jgi:hypothetical protein
VSGKKLAIAIRAYNMKTYYDDSMKDQQTSEIGKEEIPLPPLSATTPVPSAIIATHSTYALSGSPEFKRRVYVFLGVLALLLIFVAAIAVKSLDPVTPDSQVTNTDVPVTPPTLAHDLNMNSSSPVTPDSQAAMEVVPVTPPTLAYDLNQDGIISNLDVMIVAQEVDQGQYNAMEDFDSSGSVNLDDLRMIRTAIFDHTVVFYDLNQDQRIDAVDISLVAQSINLGEYAAILDFDSSGSVNLSDLEMIRSAVAQAGVVTSLPVA